MHPRRVDRLVLIDSSGLDVPDVPEWELLKIPVVGPLLMRFVTVGAVRRRLEHAFYRKELVTDEMALEVFLPLRLRHNRTGQILTARNQDWSLTEKAMPLIENPALILWGEHDRYLPVSLLERFRQKLPRCSARILRDCGHSPHEEYPREVNGLVTDFLSPG
jgi:pimeloyl-ACP methyl ester carboxylesterase